MTLDAPVLAAVASPRRREILRLVWEQELQAGAIHQAMPDVTFGAVSLHLRALAEAGLVDVRVEGRQRIYRARREALGPIGQMPRADVGSRPVASQGAGRVRPDAPRPAPKRRRRTKQRPS